MPPVLVQLAAYAMKRLHLEEHDVVDAYIRGRYLVLVLAGSQRGLIDAKVVIAWK